MLKTSSSYDYVVVGSGFAALAFIDEMLRLRPQSKILCLERGPADAEDHFRNLQIQANSGTSWPNACPDVVPSETVWRVGRDTVASKQIIACAGAAFVLGGRSNYWYGWCMKPELKQSRGFSASLAARSSHPEFWNRASSLLNVTSVEGIGAAWIEELQRVLHCRLEGALPRISGARDTQPAEFSQGDAGSAHLKRFAAAPRLRQLVDAGSLDLLVDHRVDRLCVRESKAVITISTSQGDLALAASTKVVLCAGTVPNAVLLSDSFPHLRTVIGTRISGHFRTHIFAKVPKAALFELTQESAQRKQWGLAAEVIRGAHPETDREYHIQLSAFYCPGYEGRYQNIVGQLPRYGTAPVPDHLKGIEHDIIISCSSLGELEGACRLWRDDSKQDASVELQIALTDEDESLWELMDNATFQAIESVTGTSTIAYWNSDSSEWTKRRPSPPQRRSSLLVHEAGSTPLGSVVDENFQASGVENVVNLATFVVGSSVLPSAGSWNPTLTTCALAQDLARSQASTS